MVREYLLNVLIIVKKEVDKCGGFLTIIGMKQTKCVSFFGARPLKKKFGASVSERPMGTFCYSSKVQTLFSCERWKLGAKRKYFT